MVWRLYYWEGFNFYKVTSHTNSISQTAKLPDTEYFKRDDADKVFLFRSQLQFKFWSDSSAFSGETINVAYAFSFLYAVAALLRQLQVDETAVETLWTTYKAFAKALPASLAIQIPKQWPNDNFKISLREIALVLPTSPTFTH